MGKRNKSRCLNSHNRNNKPKKPQHISKDVIIHCLVPYISYFDLDYVLKTLGMTLVEIENVKAIEYKKRLTFTKTPVEGYYRTFFQREWRVDGVLHREKGPAYVDEFKKIWYYNGVLHNSNGPAIIDGMDPKRIRYYRNGILHRDDGPAMINIFIGGVPYAYCWWYKHGVKQFASPPVSYLNDRLSGNAHLIYGNEYVRQPSYRKKNNNSASSHNHRKKIENHLYT
jgi:hypothetical protein